MFLAKKRPAANASSPPLGLFPALTIKEYKKSVSADWFASPSTLALHALGPRLCLPDGLADTVPLRGVFVCNALGLCPMPAVCPNDKKHKLVLAEEWEAADGVRFRLRCSSRGNKCYRARLCPAGLLSNIHVPHWLAFVYFVNAMRLNYRWSKIMADIEAVFGVKNKRTFQSWRALYQDALTQYMLKHKSMILGTCPGDVVVFDETHMGSQRGISKSSSTERATSRSKPIVAMKVLKRLPARTIHKRPALRRPAASSASRPAAQPLRRPASVKKSIFNKNKRGTDKDARSGGRWLFAAVLVGRKTERYTHENGKKKFSFAILPKPALAPDHKSRGKESMKQAILSCISQKAFLVHDSWKASTAAIEDLGFKAAPPVNHSVGWRDTSTGFHSNDIESEFSRLKNMVRERYGRLSFQATASASDNECIDAGDLYEYTFFVNIGKDFHDVLKALRLVSPV